VLVLRQLLKDEHTTDELCTSIQDAHIHVEANMASRDTDNTRDCDGELVSTSQVDSADADTAIPDGDNEEVSTGEVTESQSHGVVEPVKNVEDAGESREQESLISFDGDVDLSGPAADKDASEYHIKKHVDDIPSESQHLANADDVASDD